MKGLLFLFLLVLSIQPVFSQPVWDWTHQADTTFGSRVLSAASDSSGNVYIAGQFWGPQFVFQQLSILNQNVDFPYTVPDAFLIKLSIDGTPLWIKSIGGMGSESPNSIVIGNNNRLLVTGSATGSSAYVDQDSIVFDHIAGCFLVAMDLDGNVQWTTSWGGSSTDFSSDLATDFDGNVVVVGNFISDTIRIDTFSVAKHSTGTVDSDSYVIKFSANGLPMWLASGTSNDNDFMPTVAIDGGGSIYIGLEFLAASFNYDAQFNIARSMPFGTPCIMKLNAEGVQEWVQCGSGDQAGSITDLQVDQQGNVYSLGWLRGQSIQFDELSVASRGLYNTYIGKISSSGNFTWLQAGGSSGIDFPKSLALDNKDGLVLVVKTTNGDIRFADRILDIPLGQATSNWALFFVKYDLDGNLLNLSCPIYNTYLGDFQPLCSSSKDQTLFLAGSFSADSMAIGNTLLSAPTECSFISKISAFPPYVELPDSTTPDFTIFPNPAMGSFIIRIESVAPKMSSFSAYDPLGRKIISNQDLQLGDNIIEGLGLGVWTIIVYGKDQQIIGKSKQVIARR
jgi:hypothetical protein